MAVKRDYTEPTRKGCKRCGSKTVAWQQSNEGRWYLTEVFTDANDRHYTEHSLLHSPFCKGDKNHDAEQALRLKAERDEQGSTEILRAKREQKRAEEGASEILGLLALTPEEQWDKLRQLEAEAEWFQRNPPTMDYMVEFTRAIAEEKHRQGLIGFLRGVLAPTEDAD